MLILFAVLLAAVEGHSNGALHDADMQSALMPQELNPAFVPGKDEPWRAVMPVARQRRFAELSPGNTSVAEQVKRYSRVIACVVLALSAAVEIVLYFVESYSES